jgi:hypothetical protein
MPAISCRIGLLQESATVVKWGQILAVAVMARPRGAPAENQTTETGDDAFSITKHEKPVPLFLPRCSGYKSILRHDPNEPQALTRTFSNAE